MGTGKCEEREKAEEILGEIKVLFSVHFSNVKAQGEEREASVCYV